MFLVISCQTEQVKEEAEVMGLETGQMDLTADPKNDFYRFANGTWLDSTEIPADEGRWGGFNELRDANNKILLDVLNEAGRGGRFEDGSDEQKAIDFFAVGMDSLLAERGGMTPVQHWLDKIDAISKVEDIQGVVAELHKSGYNAFHGLSVFADLMNSDVNSFYVSAEGLGLPNRDYYTKTDQKSKEIREKYVTHLERMLALALGDGSHDQMAQNIMEIEKNQ